MSSYFCSSSVLLIYSPARDGASLAGASWEEGRHGSSSLPHISVQSRHQSLAEMSVLQAGDRPLNVNSSQVNIASERVLHRHAAGERRRERLRQWEKMKMKGENMRTLMRGT